MHTYLQTQPVRSRIAERASALMIVGATAFAAACGTTAAPDALTPGDQGRIRFVTLITDTTRGRVDAILESVPFGVNLTYTQSTPATLPAPATALYSPILAGSRSLVLNRTANTATNVATFALTITAGQDRTIYAIGGAGGTPITPFSTVDDNALPASTAQTKVRVVHLSPTAGALDVFVTAPGTDLSVATPTLSNVAFVSASTYLSFAAGSYQLRAVPTGTPAANRAAAVAITVNLALIGNTVRTIVAADSNVGGAPLRAFVLADR